MTNPQCPFCKTPLSEHEAGRCLDKWVAKVQGAVFYYEGSDEYIKWPDKFGNRFPALAPLNSGYGDELMPQVSTDMNEAIELKPDDNDWVQFERLIPRTGAEPGDILMNGINADREWVITDWDRIGKMLSGTFSNLDTEDEEFVIAKAPTLALAICRAYLIEQMKEERL